MILVVPVIRHLIPIAPEAERGRALLDAASLCEDLRAHTDDVEVDATYGPAGDVITFIYSLPEPSSTAAA